MDDSFVFWVDVTVSPQPIGFDLIWSLVYLFVIQSPKLSRNISKRSLLEGRMGYPVIRWPDIPYRTYLHGGLSGRPHGTFFLIILGVKPVYYTCWLKLN